MLPKVLYPNTYNIVNYILLLVLYILLSCSTFYWDKYNFK